MSHSALAIEGFYDHEEQTQRRAPDWGGDDLFTTAPPRRRQARGTRDLGEDGRFARTRGDHAPSVPSRHDEWISAADEAPTAADFDRYLEPVPAGRRTVTITGRAGGFHTTVTRRPARTIDERIAHRPERIASWTCAMGFLLILLAILTSH